MSHLSNIDRLKRMAKEMPIVGRDENIAVFGAAGQIGVKLKPILDKLYPVQVVYCDQPSIAK